MAYIQFELFPALVGVGTYISYILLTRLLTRGGLQENAATRKDKSKEFDSKEAEVVDDRSAAGEVNGEEALYPEPDQEPSPSEETATDTIRSTSGSKLLRIVTAAVVFILFTAIAAACICRLDLKTGPEGGSRSIPLARAGVPMLERWRKHHLAETVQNEIMTTVPISTLQGDLSPSPSSKGMLSVKLTKQKVENEQAEEDFVRSAYYGTLMVGSPPEPFTVVFDTGSGHLVLPSTYCRSETCRVHKRYRRSTSTTGKDINHNGVVIDPGKVRDQISVSFGTGEVTGVFVEDIVCVDQGEESESIEPNTTTCTQPDTCGSDVYGAAAAEANSSGLAKGCVNFRFIAATELSEDPFKDFQFDGILGLGLDGLSQTEEFNYMNVISRSVSASGSAAPQTFGVFLGNNELEDSEIALGGWAEKHLTEDLSWSDVPHPEMGHWLVSIRSIRVGSEKLSFCEDGSCKAAVDTGTSLLAVPTAVFPELYEELKHPAPLAGHCTGAGPLLHFELDEITITLGPRDYSRAEKTGRGNPRPSFGKAKSNPVYRRDMRCNPMLMTLDLPEPLGPKLFILGEPVLRKYYTAYDGKGKRVGFGRARHLVAPSRDELLVLAGKEGKSSTRAPTMFDVFSWRKKYR